MAQTILHGSRETTVAGASAEGARLWVPLADLEPASGWELKPQGLCRDDTCVPVPSDRRSLWIDERAKRFDLAAFADFLGEAVVHDADRSVWAFGPQARPGAETGSGPVEAPDFTLPDLDGREHTLSSFRGKKVFLVAWASW